MLTKCPGYLTKSSKSSVWFESYCRFLYFMQTWFLEESIYIKSCDKRITYEYIWPVWLINRRGPASLRGSSAMNSRELAADVPLATQESDEDEFEVGLLLPPHFIHFSSYLVCWTTNRSSTCSPAKHCGLGRWAMYHTLARLFWNLLMIFVG